MEQDGKSGVCPLCDGTGFCIVERAGGSRAARACQCRFDNRAARMLERARIPKRYEHCTLEEFDTGFKGCTKSVKQGFLTATHFVRSYPVATRGNGLLFTGTIGSGKTHLAVGILQALIVERGAIGLFCDYRELLKQVQNTYNKSVQRTELDVLAPVFAAEVLVLDELGAAKPTEWVWDMVATILNTRYNDRKTTIITANYANEPPLGAPQDDASGGAEGRSGRLEESLGDRIGERMRSRLHEMCVPVPLFGQDFRKTVNLASIG